MLDVAVCVIRGHSLKESVIGIENTRKDNIDDRLCSVQRSQTCCHLVCLYYASEKDKPMAEGGGARGFKWDPRYETSANSIMDGYKLA